MTYTSTTYTLGRGDSDPNGITFGGGDSYDFRIGADGVDAPEPPLKVQYSAGATRDGADAVESHRENRTVTIPFRSIAGSDLPTLRANIANLHALLEDAVRYATKGEGQPVVLTVKSEGESTPRYLDVLSGTFPVPSSATMKLWRDLHMIWQPTLTLTCRPFARGDAVTVSATAQRTNNAGAWIDVNSVPGDVPALFQLAIEDQSTSGAINKVLVNIRHETQGGTPANAVFARPGVAAGSATDLAEPNSLDGANVRTVTPGSTWSDVATVTVTSDLVENSGLLRILLRVRDRNGLAPPSLTSIVRYRGGSLTTYQTYYYCVTAVNGSGETVASVVGSTTTHPWARSLQPRWTKVSGATGYRLYRKTGSSGAWGYISISGGSVTGFTDNGSVTPTTANPPDSGSAVALTAAAQWRILHGFANEPESQWQVSNVLPMGVAGGAFELLGMDEVIANQYPPRQVPTGYASPGYVSKLQARLIGNITGEVDADGIVILHQHGSYAEAEYSRDADTANTMLARWVLDQTADEQLGGMLVDASTDVPLATIATTGSLCLMPGDNRAFVTALKASNVHDVSSTKFTLSGRYIPRYLEIL